MANADQNAAEAVAHLEVLAKDLERRGYTARPARVGEHAGIRVIHQGVSQLSETIHVAPVADGDWWFWWSWGDPIAPAGNVDAAAFKIAYVLTPQSHG